MATPACGRSAPAPGRAGASDSTPRGARRGPGGRQADARARGSTEGIGCGARGQQPEARPALAGTSPRVSQVAPPDRVSGRESAGDGEDRWYDEWPAGLTMVA